MAQKVKRFKQGSGVKSGSSSSDGLQNVDYRLSPNMGSGLGLGGLGGGSGGRSITPSSGSGVSFGGMSSPVGKVYGVRDVPVGGGNLSFGASPMSGGRVGASYTIPLTKKKAKGGSIKKMAKGGSTASKRGDGCATKGKTKGRFV